MTSSPPPQSQPQPETLISINEVLRDDELLAILSKLDSDKDKDLFGLVCKRWLRLQSCDRQKICARAGPHMLRKMAARFTRLLHLDLSQSLSRSFYPGVTDSDLHVISLGFPVLRLLDLHNCKGITDTGLLSIGSNLHSLQSLDVSYCRKLTDKGLSSVAEGCKDLRRLHIAGCRFISDNTLQVLSRNCPYLQELSLHGCTNITDSGLTTLVKGCTHLNYLDLNKCTNVGDTGISSVSKSCSTTIKTLKLLDCYKVGNRAISDLARFCNGLETLIIGGCRDISDEPMRLLAQSCKYNLKNLRMDWCLSITDSALSCILSSCRNLQVLDIGCCEEVTDAAFQGLGVGEDYAANLKVIRVSNCPKITVTGVSLILRSCKFLEYLDVRSCPQVTRAGLNEAGVEIPEGCNVKFNGSLTEPDVLI